MIKLKPKTPNLKPNVGFTLIETLVAIAILLLAIVGPLTIASQSLNSAYYANDQVTAFFLAQEGIEYMRYLRDGNFITQNVANGTQWDAGISACTTLCGLDAPSIFTNNGGASSPLINCTSIATCPVQYDSGGLYRQGTNNRGTIFFRTIQVTQLSSYEDQVVVNVYWAVGNLKAPANFSITEDLFNWDNTSSGFSGPGGGGTQYSLTVKASGSGSGTVTSNSGGINCGSTCSANYTSGTVVTLTETPNANSHFQTWGAQCAEGSLTGPTCTITINGNTSFFFFFQSGS